MTIAKMCNGAELRSGRLTVEEIEIIETIIYQLTGEKVCASDVEYTQRTMGDIELVQGLGYVESSSYGFPAKCWNVSQHVQLIVADLGSQRAFYYARRWR